MHSGAWKNAGVSLHLSHMSAIWLPCVFWMLKKKKKAAFQSKWKKESLIRLAAALWTKLLSADALQLKLAWVMSSDALQYWENNADKKINKRKRNAGKFQCLFRQSPQTLQTSSHAKEHFIFIYSLYLFDLHLAVKGSNIDHEWMKWKRFIHS